MPRSRKGKRSAGETVDFYKSLKIRSESAARSVIFYKFF